MCYHLMVVGQYRPTFIHTRKWHRERQACLFSCRPVVRTPMSGTSKLRWAQLFQYQYLAMGTGSVGLYACNFMQLAPCTNPACTVLQTRLILETRLLLEVLRYTYLISSIKNSSHAHTHTHTILSALTSMWWKQMKQCFSAKLLSELDRHNSGYIVPLRLRHTIQSDIFNEIHKHFCKMAPLYWIPPPPAQPFYGPFSGTTRVSQCQKRTSGLYGARED